ncbi:spore coat protein [Lysinibacillus endophyticus]|uniref:Spore coat protein n=1 Tax=Ureibacillus endophyticus TaxID=1978490 RepID=A0A494Z7L3_9BACL|nr:spore coat protein [Lysinibacillus endophyticus]
MVKEVLKGVKYVSNENSPKGIPNKVVDLLVTNILRKNGVNIEQAKNKLSEEDKQALKEMVEDLKAQVDEFVKQNSKK